MNDLEMSGSCRGLTMEQWEAMRKEAEKKDAETVACRHCGIIVSRKYAPVYLVRGKTVMECKVCNHETDLP